MRREISPAVAPRQPRLRSALVVLVVAAPPAARLVAPLGCAVEPLVHAPEAVQSARISGIGVVDDAVLERERAHARPLARVCGPPRAVRRRSPPWPPRSRRLDDVNRQPERARRLPERLPGRLDDRCTARPTWRTGWRRRRRRWRDQHEGSVQRCGDVVSSPREPRWPSPDYPAS